MDATQWILIGFIALLIIVYPIMIATRNKKENQRMQEQTNSLKRGDRIITTSGIYGKIVDLQLDNDKKIVTIETGTEKNKGYVSVDAYAIYSIIKDEEIINEQQTPAVEEKKEEPQVQETVEEKKEEKKKNKKKWNFFFFCSNYKNFELSYFLQDQIIIYFRKSFV